MIINNLRIGLEGYELLRIEDKYEMRVHVELRGALEPKLCPYCAGPMGPAVRAGMFAGLAT